MQFRNVTVKNFGLFSGEYSLNLLPLKTGKRNTIMVSGHNGAGKTTLFHSIPLALHGSLAIGERMSQKDYLKILSDYMHRPLKGKSSEETEIAVELDYVHIGVAKKVKIIRSWSRNGDAVMEDLSALEFDTQEKEWVDVNTVDVQGWINDLITPAIMLSSFFDAEELSALIYSNRRNERLKDMFKRLLGLHLVDRLQGDLKTHINKQGGGKKVNVLRTEMLDEQERLQEFENTLVICDEKRHDIEAKIKLKQKELAKQERRLISEGGSYAEKRESWQKELENVEVSIKEVSSKLTTLANELLPFTLTPNFVGKLEKRLDEESSLQKESSAHDVIIERNKALLKEVKKKSFVKGLGLSKEAEGQLFERFDKLLSKSGNQAATETIHDLSSNEFNLLKTWIIKIRELTTGDVIQLGSELKTLRKKQEDLIEYINRAPEEKSLKPIYSEVKKLTTSISALEAARRKEDVEYGINLEARDGQLRVFEKARKEFENSRKGDLASDLAIKSQTVLSVYQDAFIQQRLQSLESELVMSFNQMCRKEHLLKDVSIESDSFEITLIGKNDHGISLSDFSAGERQLFILALLQALRNISGYELPLFIDTPFARLDELHRDRLIDTYFPKVSEQVVLFATDEEAKVFATDKKKLARAFEVKQDDKKGASTLTEVWKASTTKPPAKKSKAGVANVA